MVFHQTPFATCLEVCFILVQIPLLAPLQDDVRLLCIVIHILTHLNLMWILFKFSDHWGACLIAGLFCVLSLMLDRANTNLQAALLPCFLKSILAMFSIVFEHTIYRKRDVHVLLFTKK